MAESNDRRVRRTRKLLQEGLLDLLGRKPLEDITVKELADAADVARATVYVHYRDPADILAQIEQEVYSGADAILRRHDPRELAQSPDALLEDFFAYAQDKQAVFSVLLGEHGDREFIADLRALFAEQAAAALRLQYPGASESALAYQAAFLVGGYETILRQWLAGGCQEAAEDLARIAGSIA